ncbi:hypothetical protein [Leifsonia sp. EB34]|uniref:hypothetical protein n=1 Tax=Leifsonia sp. EB34 TaxID=3156303 RepID=UPI003519258D
MTDRHDEAPEYREHELQDRISDLGDTPEDALEEIASRNESLEERLPDEELSVSGRAEERSSEGSNDEDRHGEGATGDDVPRAEGAPGQG